ncbi:MULTISPECIES: hypothetical protein [Lysinibacillus]|uniref:Uncharacterized protein n=1 Tax=Lysinibacillus fusiformis TaxID=28031 RepID=A0A2I0V414_9BACI|nr:MULTISPECIES: hypothetical protein [Lysinibacillus]MEE3807270.1 hypothetical protein [Lysinibacillus fusiformis]PKU53049.1 hypothetical protein CRI88_01580 [Lysinibacillus fusiformis]WCH49002.1 hypothetical protein NV349_06350 [Lysinibacillus sp. OF-1]SCX93402.1 hypothetical protein SAMN02787078_00539 [Lysinibacillus sp. SG9]SDB06973.1 hypothetical protein SAMN02787079_00538 [Lysinibacillus sp. TC-37]
MAKAIQKKVESMESKNVEKVISSNLPKFTKEQLSKSQKYKDRRDALNALLEKEKTYSFAQVDEILKKFDKGGN